uniref:ADP-ribosylation factor-like protein 13B n=2 Tax=Caenorhabditis japonica TaxID=281687 RepID=A0A8R1I4F2_CAEJA
MSSWLQSVFCCCNNTPIPKRFGCVKSEINCDFSEIKLGCFGIGGAGKSTFLKVLKGEDPREVLSVNGFIIVDMDFDEQFHLKIFDVGGDRGIRGIWGNYYGEVHGIIYVIDYSTDETFDESIEALSSVTSHPQAQKKPIFLLVNNQYSRELDDVEVSNAANLQAGQHNNAFFSHFNKYNGFLNNVKTATMSVSQRAKKDKLEFQEQFVRFIDSISQNYVELNEGVKAAELALKIRQEQAKEERRLKQMKVEHDALRADVAALEGRPLPQPPPDPTPTGPPPDPKLAAVRREESPPLSLASSTIPSDIVQGSPEGSSQHDPVNFCRISQSSTKPASPQSVGEVQQEEPPKAILRDNYFLPPKTPGRQYSRIQRIQNVLSNRVAPK